MSDISFRPIESSDIPELTNWHSDDELAGRYGGVEWPQKLWDIMSKDSNRRCWIALKDQLLIGYVDIELHPQEHIFWIGIAVKPQLRKQGLGTLVLQTFFRNLPMQDYKEAWAGIEKDNAASRACFEKVGFTAKNPNGDQEGIIDYMRSI